MTRVCRHPSRLRTLALAKILRLPYNAVMRSWSQVRDKDAWQRTRLRWRRRLLELNPTGKMLPAQRCLRCGEYGHHQNAVKACPRAR